MDPLGADPQIWVAKVIAVFGVAGMSGIQRRDGHAAVEIAHIREALGAVAAAEPAVLLGLSAARRPMGRKARGGPLREGLRQPGGSRGRCRAARGPLPLLPSVHPGGGRHVRRRACRLARLLAQADRGQRLNPESISGGDIEQRRAARWVVGERARLCAGRLGCGGGAGSGWARHASAPSGAPWRRAPPARAHAGGAPLPRSAQPSSAGFPPRVARSPT